MPDYFSAINKSRLYYSTYTGNYINNGFELIKLGLYFNINRGRLEATTRI
jgi:hypothetical protein